MALKSILAALVTVGALVIALILAVGSYQHHQPLDAGWAGLLAVLLGGAVGQGEAIKKRAEQLAAKLSPPDPKPDDPPPAAPEAARE